MALTVKGDIDEYIAIDTLKRLTETFFSVWAHYTPQTVPKRVRDQVLDYVHSDRLRTIVPELYDHNPTELVNLLELFETFQEETTYFHTYRMRIQMAVIAIMPSFSAQRPCLWNIIDLIDYFEYRKPTLWSHIDWNVIPNAADPAHPTLVAQIRTYEDYGDYRAASFYLSFACAVLQTQLLGCLAEDTGPLGMLLRMALDDGIFQDVRTAQEILEPRYHPTRAHILSIRKELLDTPVMRAEVHDDATGWSMSKTLALPHDVRATYLKWGSDQAQRNQSNIASGSATSCPESEWGLCVLY
ncbi:hypothetical protein FA95DRAFT_1079487 [Auriscalpium vulgare]|uniref:Uncharacterized protein n=1 Tax=Auriscalpium vulgare TaxID=40419 RepID=A0ACB8RXQ4_9AGAM|nr:hypothetical protein FA95DRAFT_1079487 [Auriscalpium vulgare]